MPCLEMKTIIAYLALFVLGVHGSSSVFLEENCGVVPRLSYKIINGTPARLGRYPWMAFLHTPTYFLCAGSLINQCSFFFYNFVFN